MERLVLLLILRLGVIVGGGIVIVGLIALFFTSDVLRLHVLLLIVMGSLFATFSGIAIWLIRDRD